MELNTYKSSIIFTENSLSKGAEIGVISWNVATNISIRPSTKIEDIRASISKIIAQRNTCFGRGLNESIKLLEQYNDEKRKCIIILSDGEQNCTTDDDPCAEVTRAKELGIKVFYINIGPINGSISLDCLEDSADAETFYITNIKELNTIYKMIEYSLFSNHQYVIKSEPGEEFNLVANASKIEVREPITNVSVMKVIEFDEKNSSPKIIFRINTPPIDKMDVVLSLDSSGSMILNNGDKVIRKGLTNSINNFLNNLASKNISSRIAIVSWDDDIDFVYHDNNSKNFLGRDPTKAIMIKGNASPKSKFQNDLNNYIIPVYDSQEEQTTDLNVGVSTPLTILQNNKPLDPNAFRCVLLVVGRGEFKNYSSITSIPYRIYPLGLNPGPDMEKSLRNLAQISNGKYIYSTGSISDFEDELDKLFKKFIDEAAYNTSVARDVIIYDSLYPYLKPDLSSIKGAKLIAYNNKTNTLAMKIDNGLLAGENHEISFDISFDIELPVEITRERTAIGYQPSNLAPISNISYVWHTNIPYTIELPENRIYLKNDKKNPKESPATLDILSALSILLAYHLRRSTKW